MCVTYCSVLSQIQSYSDCMYDMYPPRIFDSGTRSACRSKLENAVFALRASHERVCVCMHFT